MSARRFQFFVDHMIGRQEVERVVTYCVTPGSPETGPSYACGGTPADPDEVQIVSIKHNGQPIALSDEEEEALWEMAIGRAGDDLADEYASEADWRLQEARDRQLMERWEREP
jgi:hypothetical protein